MLDKESSKPAETPGQRPPRRAYTAPKIMSVERLEAAASTCSGGTGGVGPGKTISPVDCSILSS